MSLRTLTRDAQVNLAAVNYHFGSKQELVLAMMRHHIDPINEARLQRLGQSREEAKQQPIALSKIVSALIEPVATQACRDASGPECFLKSIARFMAESDTFIHEKFEALFKDVSVAFCQELARCLPDQSKEDVQWGFHFAVSSMLGAFMRKGLFIQLGLMQPGNQATQHMMARLNAYICAGLQARSCSPTQYD
jgi:AcrR family transcriptional regulator